MYNTGFGRSLRGGIAPQCCHRHVSLPARSGSCPPPRSGAASCGGYLSPPVRRGLWRVISILRIWVSSAFLRHSDETQILLKSQPQICAMGADGQQSQGVKAIDSFIPVARISDMLLHPGESFTYQGETRTYPDVRLVYWAGVNPFHHHQDLNRLSEAWQRPETISVQDPMWPATARRADIVLPASTSIERNDLAGNKRSDVIAAMHKAIEPLGQARSDFDIFNA